MLLSVLKFGLHIQIQTEVKSPKTQKIQFRNQAAILKVTSLKIYRIFFSFTQVMYCWSLDLIFKRNNSTLSSNIPHSTHLLNDNKSYKLFLLVFIPLLQIHIFQSTFDSQINIFCNFILVNPLSCIIHTSFIPIFARQLEIMSNHFGL